MVPAKLNLDRIAELVVGVDRLARDIPSALTDLRSVEGTSLSRSLPTLSEALRLAISLEVPPTQLAVDAANLEACFRRLQQLSVGSRLSSTSKAALDLGVALASQLASEFKA